MQILTKEQFLAAQPNWKMVAERELEELRALTIEEKLRKLIILHSFGTQFSKPEQNVRKKWRQIAAQRIKWNEKFTASTA